MAPDAPTPDPSPAEPAFWSLPSGPQIAHWFIEQFRAGTFQNPGGDATLLSDNPICSVWLLATVDHDEQMFHLLDIHTGESHDLLFVTHGLRESFGCEWRQEPTDVLPWGADALVWFSERIEFAEEASGIPLVWSYTDGSCGPMPDPSPDTPSVYAPRCGHHHNPLTWLGDEHRWRCPYCFPELFPATPTAPGSSSPDTAAPTLVEVIWATLEAHGMGVLRKAELDALNADRARLRVLEEAIRQHRDNSTLYDADDFALWAHLKEDA